MINLVNNLIGWVNTNPQIATVYILGITCFIGLLYSVFTLGLFREAKKQRELSVSPSLIVQLKQKKNLNKHQIVLKNVGPGVALDIRVLFPLNIWTPSKSKFEKYSYKFKKIDHLVSSEEIPLIGESFMNDKKVRFDVFDHFFINPQKYKFWTLERNNTKFVMEYQNGQGSGYFTHFYFGKDGINKISIRRKSLLLFVYYVIEEWMDVKFLKTSLRWRLLLKMVSTKYKKAFKKEAVNNKD